MNRDKSSVRATGGPLLDYFVDLQEEDVLCDRHRQECYQVTGIDRTGIGLRQDGAEFFVPGSLFVILYKRRLFSINDTQSIDAPEWCSRQQAGSETTDAGQYDRDVHGCTRYQCRGSPCPTR